MGQIIWRQAAIDDLGKIYDYIAQDSPTRASRFTAELTDKTIFLSENPYVGENKLPSFPNIRVFPHKNYLFIFEPTENAEGIELLRIIHGAQDYLNWA